MEVDWNGCYKIHPERPASNFKWMLRSFQSFLEVFWSGCYKIHQERPGSDFKWMVQRSTQRILQVTSSGCYNVASRASWKLIDMDVTYIHLYFWLLASAPWHEALSELLLFHYVSFILPVAWKQPNRQSNKYMRWRTCKRRAKTLGFKEKIRNFQENLGSLGNLFSPLCSSPLKPSNDIILQMATTIKNIFIQ